MGHIKGEETSKFCGYGRENKLNNMNLLINIEVYSCFEIDLNGLLDDIRHFYLNIEC